MHGESTVSAPFSGERCTHGALTVHPPCSHPEACDKRARTIREKEADDSGPLSGYMAIRKT